MYKLEQKGDKIAFVPSTFPPPKLAPNTKTLLVKETAEGIDISFDGDLVQFVKSDEGLKSFKIYKIRKSQSIFFDDSYKGYIAPDSLFKVSTQRGRLDWKKSADGLYQFIVPIKRGFDEISIEHENQQYYVQIRVE